MVYLFSWVQKQQSTEAEQHFSTLMTHFIIKLHFNNGFAITRHCSPQINICGFILQPRAVCLRADKVTEVFPIIHLAVQMFVAGTGLLNHAHGQQVLVQVLVEGHRKHDGNAIGAHPALHVEQVVGQQADRARGGVVVLGEGAHFGLGGTNRRLGRVLTEATCHVNPVQKRRRQILTITTNQSATFT